MSRPFVSKDRSEKGVQEQDQEDIITPQVVGAEENESSSLVITRLTRQTVPMLAKAVQTDEAELPLKEVKYLSKNRLNSGMYFITTKANMHSSRFDAKCSHELDALSCNTLRSGDRLSTQVEQDGRRTRFCAGVSHKSLRKGVKSNPHLLKDRVYLDKGIDLGSLPVTKFPHVPPSKVNLVTMKANTTDADMFRENPASPSNFVLQKVCLLEMSRMIPDLSR